MKKFFAVVLATVFVFGILSGCGKKEDRPKKEEIHFGADITIQQFKENITVLAAAGEAVMAEKDSLVAYTLKTEPKYKVDGKVVFKDGSISMPDGHVSLIKNGFTSEYNVTDPVFNEMQGQAILYDTTDGTVGMKFYLDEEADSYGTISGVRYTVLVMGDDGEIPWFELTGGITRDSAVEDIIKQYGMPKTLGFEAVEKKILLDYETPDGNYMLFRFGAEGSEMKLEWFEMKYTG